MRATMVFSFVLAPKAIPAVHSRHATVRMRHRRTLVLVEHVYGSDGSEHPRQVHADQPQRHVNSSGAHAPIVNEWTSIPASCTDAGCTHLSRWH